MFNRKVVLLTVSLRYIGNAFLSKHEKNAHGDLPNCEIVLLLKGEN